MSRGQNSGGPWEYAEDFMDGYRIADRKGMAWEYVESFLANFKESKDTMTARRLALQAWDLL